MHLMQHFAEFWIFWILGPIMELIFVLYLPVFRCIIELLPPKWINKCPELRTIEPDIDFVSILKLEMHLMQHFAEFWIFWILGPIMELIFVLYLPVCRQINTLYIPKMMLETSKNQAELTLGSAWAGTKISPKWPFETGNHEWWMS